MEFPDMPTTRYPEDIQIDVYFLCSMLSEMKGCSGVALEEERRKFQLQNPFVLIRQLEKEVLAGNANLLPDEIDLAQADIVDTREKLKVAQQGMISEKKVCRKKVYPNPKPKSRRVRRRLASKKRKR